MLAAVVAKIVSEIVCDRWEAMGKLAKDTFTVACPPVPDCATAVTIPFCDTAMRFIPDTTA